MATEGAHPTVSRQRLLAFYAVLIVFATVGAGLSIRAGNDQHAQAQIAGGYESTPPDGCLGTRFDLVQSGQFVNLESTEGTPTAKLRLRDGSLTGRVQCVDGRNAPLTAAVSDDTLRGFLAGTPVSASRTSDAPPPGSQTARAPGSIAADYSLTPESRCLGGSIRIDDRQSGVAVIAEDRTLGTADYHDGELSGRARCLDGGEVAIEGIARDRDLDLTLTPAATQPGSAGRGPAAAAAPPQERLQAERTREFGKTLAAFFIAVAVVVLVARAFGWLAVRVAQPRVMGEVIAGIVLGPTVFGALLPDLQVLVFPVDVIPLIGVVANLGLIFYMFLVGLELDLSQLRGATDSSASRSRTPASPCPWCSAWRPRSRSTR